MKKRFLATLIILSLTIFAVVALTSCSDKQPNGTTTVSSPSTVAEQTTDITQPTSSSHSERSTEPATSGGATATASSTAATVNSGNPSGPPIFNFWSIDELVEFERNIETMNENDLYYYLCDTNLAYVGINDAEKAAEFLEDFKSVYLPSRDDNVYRLMSYYPDRNMIRTNSAFDYGYYQFNINTQPCKEEDLPSLSENKDLRFAFEKQYGDATVKMYSRLNKIGYTGRVLIGDRVITMWINEPISVEQLEKDIGRFRFVTIGELIDEAR